MLKRDGLLDRRAVGGRPRVGLFEEIKLDPGAALGGLAGDPSHNRIDFTELSPGKCVETQSSLLVGSDPSQADAAGKWATTINSPSGMTTATRSPALTTDPGLSGKTSPSRPAIGDRITR